MLKIRLTRRGKKNRAFFRIVVTESSWPVKGRFLESLGFFNPHTKEKGLKGDRIKYWIEKGAQCSDTVHNLLVKEGVIKGLKRAVKMRKKEETEKGKENSEKESASFGSEKGSEKDEGLAKEEAKEENEKTKKDKEEPKAEKAIE